ncbi:myoneurin-like isoform X1 [Schistocerca cancellata]|uniref:myoneurin-like isoform X1 n=1 Tax=Schistocerca cancellata TaxID=274614 RepID=UPI0021187C4F|nr:myoneurin-like isoform X1 [Schistocerca cancellata]
MAADDSMNFSENDHANVVLEKLKAQRDQGKFCDIVLYVGGTEFRAHRNVLASCSQYFESILKTHKSIKERLTVTCQSSEIFQSLLNYMYTGCVIINKSNVSELLRLANHFLVGKLKNYCADYLDRHLDVTNCLSVRDLSEKYNLPILLKAATLFVAVNINKVLFEEELMNFSLPKMEEFLSEKAWVVPQDSLLSLISRWVQKDITARERSIRALLTFVDWSNLEATFISEQIDKDQLYSMSEISFYFVLQSLAESNLLFPKYQSAYQALQQKFPQGGCSLDSDTFLTMAVSTAIEEFQETSDNRISSIPSRNMDQEPTHELPEKRNCEAVTVTGSRKLTKKRRMHWRNKHKLLRSANPTSRITAFKNAISTCHKRFCLHHKKQKRGKLKLCHLCTFTTSDISQLEQHMAAVHAREMSYKCGLCGFVCHLNKDYYSHMKTEHFQGPPFKCDTCSYTADKIQQLLSHRLQHSDEPLYKCQQCDYECRTRSSLLLHMHSHAGEKAMKCDICGKAFSNTTSLEHHLITHSSDRPYMCDSCGFSTKYMSHLIAHKRIHTGDVYHCSYPQCQYSTAKKSQLGSHIRVHVEQRPHSCSTCGRGFLEKSHLVRHERIHLDEKPFRCSQCEYASSRRDKLKEHFGRHHGEQASAKVPYKARQARVNHKGCSSGESGYNNSESNHQGQENVSSRTDGNAGVNTQQNSSAPPSFGFTNAIHHPSFDFHHHQILASRAGGLSHKDIHHTHMHHQSPAAAMAAMMLDPRLHASADPGSSYNGQPVPPPPPVSAAVPTSQQSGNHQQVDYPCMPLF